jgi:hypothetical protein
MAGGLGLRAPLLVTARKFLAPGSLRKGGIKIYPPKLLGREQYIMIGQYTHLTYTVFLIQSYRGCFMKRVSGNPYKYIFRINHSISSFLLDRDEESKYSLEYL